jgi:hypothetical protein
MAAHATDGVAYDGSNAGTHDSVADCLICSAHHYNTAVGQAACTACVGGKDLVNTYAGQACNEESIGACASGGHATKTACEAANLVWTAACDATNGAPGADAAADCTSCDVGEYGAGNVACTACALTDVEALNKVSGVTSAAGSDASNDCEATACSAGAVLGGVSPNRICVVSECLLNQRVQDNTCVDCKGGEWAPAGTDASLGNTVCYSGGNSIIDDTDNTVDPQGIEALDPQTGYKQKVFYSREGSLHRNKYGYIVDINGLLLVADGNTRSTDPNAKHHIHIPSRYSEVYFDGNGKIWVFDENGATYTNVGIILLSRFEDPQGLNIFRQMKSHCVAFDNEFGFMLGSWCDGTWIDGLITEYMAESVVSGPGIAGYPMEQGFGRVIPGPVHRMASFLRGQFSKAPGWSINIDGKGYFQYRYIQKDMSNDAFKNDGSSSSDGSYGAGYHAAHAADTGYE